jgi:aerobic C4-dicarboxylate transport protein
VLCVQALFAIVLGRFWPSIAVDMKPLGHDFVKLIKMVIALAIFCMVVSGMPGMSDMKKVERVGGKALVHFEFVSTLALLVGSAAPRLASPGSGFNVDTPV